MNRNIVLIMLIVIFALVGAVCIGIQNHQSNNSTENYGWAKDPTIFQQNDCENLRFLEGDCEYHFQSVEQMIIACQVGDETARCLTECWDESQISCRDARTCADQCWQ